MKTVALEDICEFKNGRGFKKSEWREQGLPIIRIQNLNKHDALFNYYQGEYDKAIEVNQGDLLFSWSGTIGSSFGAHIWEKETGVLNQHIFKVYLSDSVDKRFAYHALQWITVEIEKKVNGAVGLVHITKAKLKKFTIPLPPLDEQKRIVAIVDEAFAGIDAAVANTENNLANARELFESYLNGVFTQKGDGWVEKKLGEVCKFSSGGTPSKKNSSYWNGDIPWFSGRDMKSTQLSDSYLHISQIAVDESATRLAPVGTLLVLVRGMGLAHGAQVAELMVPSAFNQDIKGIFPKSDLISRYLVFMLRHQINSSDNVLSNAAHGTLKINTEAMKALKIIIPPLDQQNQFIAKIDSLKKETQHLEAIYQQKLKALAELKQSILQKAFAGELTTLPEKQIEEASA